jgi:hypothetical protein
MVFPQDDPIGSGRAIHFDRVNDYVDLGNIYDDLNLPFTVSAWVYVDVSTQSVYPVFVSQDNAPLYNGFWFCLSQTNLFIEYGDGNGDQNPAFRKGKSAQISNVGNRWLHITAVFKSAFDIQLYVNGFNAGGSYTGDSSQPMASNYPNDVAKIGYFFQNSAVFRYSGIMDELRMWNRALSVNEIRETMCKRLKGDEPGLIGYWNFDETSGDVLKDLSSNGFDGALKGNPTRVFSGAPVGDESVFLYTDEWTGKSLTKEDLSVLKISGNPYGVHIYTVNHVPSQTAGLNASDIEVPYYGVFLAHDGEKRAFDVAFSDKTVCKFYQRSDNSEPDWTASGLFTAINDRVELIPAFDESDMEIDLGDDIRVCDETSVVLETDVESSGKVFLWSTGENTSSIIVTSSGQFSVKVNEGCLVGKDTIEVSFLETPPDFSLGADEVMCTLEPRILGIDVDMSDFNITWHNGSNESSFAADHFGTYWLKLHNECGFSVDSITLAQLKTPPDFSLGEDEVLCPLDARTLTIHGEFTDFDITWNNGSNESSIVAGDFGTYWVKLENDCGFSIDSITFTKKVLGDVDVYNFISPDNTDLLNQFFMVDEELLGVHLFVCNRWGRSVYESFNYQNDWDGGGLPAGVYFYIIQGECIESLKGTLTIMR